MTEWSQERFLQEIWRESVAARSNSAKALREIERIDAKIDDVETRLQDNADKAHAEIGSNIAKLGDHLDRIDAEMGGLNGKVGHVYDLLEKQYG